MPLKKLLNRNGRKTIGLLTNVTNTYYDYTLFRSIHRAAFARNVNLITYNCGSLDSILSYYFEYQNNLLYYYPDPGLLDGLIFLPSMIFNYSSQSRYQNILKRLSRIPYITLSTYCDGHPGVFIDNGSGFREIINQLYHERGKRLFAFISGPSDNSESAERLKGFLDGLDDCGIKRDDRYILPGDFWLTGGHEAIRELDRRAIPRPEVIICSNDYTAIAVYEELAVRGWRIPDDVLVAGFDNTEDSRFCNPPLTTIKQPLDQMAKKAVELVLQLINGESIPPMTILPTKVVYRQSTGSGFWSLPGNRGDDPLKVIDEPQCRLWAEKWLERFPNSTNEEIISSFITLLQRTLDIGLNISIWEDFPVAINKYYSPKDISVIESLRLQIALYGELQQGMNMTRSHHNSLIIAQTIHRIISTFSIEEMRQGIAVEFPRLGIHHFFMTAYPKPFIHTITDKRRIPAKARYLFGFSEGREIGCSAESCIFRAFDLLPDDIELPNKPLSLIVVAAFFRETQYGIMMFDASSDEEQVYTSLGMQISAAYRSTLVFKEKERNERALASTLIRLKTINRKLEELSVSDPLTGLANRRGFLMLGQKFQEVANRQGKGFLVFFGDVDRLKTINDTWGHEAGDQAIILCAKALKKTFRESDILARIAGDEFTIIAVDSKRNDINRIEKRLQENIDFMNRTSGYSWKISVSLGYVLSTDYPGYTLSELLSKADHLQYERKKRRRMAADNH